MLYEGTFPRLKKKLNYFYFDDFFRKDASEKDKREALREIYQSILRKYPSTMPESVSYLKIAIASSLYRNLRSSIKVAEILGCSSFSLLKYIPQDIRQKCGEAGTLAFRGYWKKVREETTKKFMEVLDRIGPCHYNELGKKLNLNIDTVRKYAQRLEREGLITITAIPTVSSGTASRGGIRYGATKLFNGLSSSSAPKRIVWSQNNPKHREGVIKIFKEAILKTVSDYGPLTPGKRSVLTVRLRELPSDVFKELYEWYSSLSA